MSDRPRFLPNTLVALLPGIFAWSIHGVLIGSLVYLATILALISAFWIVASIGLSFRTLARIRIAIVLLAVMAVSISGMQIASI